MTNKPKAKVSVCFISPLESMQDTRGVKAAYKDLCKQISAFAEAISADPNKIVTHSVVSEDPADMVPVGQNPADVKIIELQAINKRMAKGKSQAVDANYKSKFEPNSRVVADDEDTPRVVAVDWNELKNTQQKPAVTTPSKATTAVTDTPAATPDKEKMLAALLDGKRKTEKSIAIFNFLIDKADLEVTTNDIAEASGLSNIDVSIWFSSTGSDVAAIERVGKRGKYMLNTSKLKIAK